MKNDMSKETPREIIRNAMKESETTQVALGEKIGIKQSGVSGAINRTRYSLDSFTRIINATGYVVMVGKRTEDGFEPEWEIECEE